MTFAYSKPMWEWIKTVAQRMASVVGLSDPEANGAIVRGIRAADTNLFHVSFDVYERCYTERRWLPLKGPVIAAMHS